LVDRLERRVFLAADVILNEFMAVNTRTLADEDGGFSDWIEVRNVSVAPVDLEGWHLTDTHRTPALWTFPAVTLTPGQHLVVFASEKDRAVAGSPLHTNFKLSGDGEYLALVRPDLTVADSYDPYPQQKPDMSFGVGAPMRTTARLVSSPAAARYFLPSDDGLADAWTNQDFDDSLWSAGQTGLGYEITAGTLKPLPDEKEPNDGVVTPFVNDAANNFGPADEGLDQFTARGSIAPAGDSDFYALGALDEGDVLTVAASGLPSGRGTLADGYLEVYRLGSPAPVMFNDDDGAGKDALVHRFRVPANDTYFVKARAGGAGLTGTYNVAAFVENAPGTPQPLTGPGAVVNEVEPNDGAAVASDASTAWRAVRQRSVTAGSLDSSSDSDLFRFRLTAGDTITVVADSSSGADLRVAVLNAAGTTVLASDDGSLAGNAPFETDELDARVNAYTVGTTGLLFVRVESNNAARGAYRLEVNLSSATPPAAAAWFSGVTATNLQASMWGLHSTALLRVPFDVAEEQLAAVEQLTLGVKYDDGFVAYLNGAEVARRNAPNSPGVLPFNAAATADRANEVAVATEPIDVSAFRDLLAAGRNVLAIQGLNSSYDDEDFLLLPELRATSAPVETPPGFFSRATPGALNPPVDSLGIVADTKFDHNRGFYDAPFDLAISTATPGAQIRYTTNGVAPTAATGTVYSGPVRVSGTTTLRAAAFKPGYVPSNVDTQTYIFVDDVIRQSPTGAAPAGWPATWGSNVRDYGMDPDVVNAVAYRDTIRDDLKTVPTMSIVMKLDDMFGTTSGIYSHPDQDGRAWERPASLELIYPDGTRGFQSEIGLRVRGGFSRSTNNPKHGLRVFYRAEYGDAELNFPLFGPDGASHFDGFDLRTFNNYSWSFGGDPNALFMRDVTSRDLQLAMGQPAERGDYYHLYINGQYWGLYNTDERAEANYGATYFGGSPEDYDVVKVDRDTNYTIEATDGTLAAWTQLYNLLKGTAPVGDAVYQQVQGNNPDGTPNPSYPVLLDVDNLMDYELVAIWGGNRDAPVSIFINNNGNPNNFFAVRNRNLDARQGFRFFIHDAEHTLLDVNEDRSGPFPAGTSSVTTSNPHYFFQRLSTNANFKIRMADRVQKRFFNGGVLSPQSVREVFLRRKEEIDRAVVAESARWGDSKTSPPLTRNTNWIGEVNRILNSYIPQRGAVVLNQLRADGLWPTVPAPTFGKLPGNLLSITKPASAGGTIYYTLDGSDPRLPGGSLLPNAIAYNGAIRLDAPTLVRARVLSGTTWGPMTEADFAIYSVPLRVTELMYHPAPPPAGGPFSADDFEFVELQNVGTAELDLSGVNFDKGITFTFPDGYVLAPGTFAVVVRNGAAFAERYGDAIAPAGVFTGGLNDAGERVRLVTPAETGARTLIDFTYSDAWRPRTDGTGYSLVPRDPAAAPEAWETPGFGRDSRAPGGTPGAADPGPADPVAGRRLFYSRSSFDGTAGLFADSSDDNALARDKQALLPGQRSSAVNYSSHTRGINGLFIDLANMAYDASLTAADFVFRVGTSGDPSTWPPAPAPNLVGVRRGDGVNGSDRVTIGWPDNVIRNTWLQVTVLPSARTGLTAPDVFYFGPLQGDAGNTTIGARAATVDARDEAVLRRKVSKAPVTGGNPWDFDHNGVVSVADLVLSRRAWGTSLPMFTAPAAAAAGATFSDRPLTGVVPRSAPTRRGSLESIASVVLA
jgi:hypothetical protein